jgi:hypothetical protein
VKVYLKNFHEIRVPQKISDCEFDFDIARKQYFISTVVSAESGKEAEHKGLKRINHVLGIFEVHVIIPYEIAGIIIHQISGEEPFISLMPLELRRTRFLPLPQEEIDKIGKSIELLDNLPNQETYTKRVNKAISYFRKGCYLEGDWSSEAFLNYYKAMELVSHDFRKAFDSEVSNQLRETLLKDLTELELKDLRTQKRLIQFTTKQLGITSLHNIPRIVELRNKFGAHANLKDVTISQDELNDCKILAANIIIRYLNYLEKEEKSKK